LNDFDFIVGQSHYRCHWFVAAFLSRRICAQLSIDNAICEFLVTTEDPKCEFSRFLSLGRGETITVSKSDISFYESLSEELLNDELSAAVSEVTMSDIKCDNVFVMLRRRQNVGFDISNEIEFIAVHLEDIDKSELGKFEPEILSRILSSDGLKIKSEDWLYELIWEFIEADRSYFALIQFVQFEFVSTDIARRFIESGCEFLDMIDSSIWSSVGHRFIQNVSPSERNS
jgi:hypothetical protein